jgi:hypothetical protein
MRLLSFLSLFLAVVSENLRSTGTCESYSSDKDKCLASSENDVPCSYCTSAAVGSLCAPESDTKSLPSSVFHCDFQTPTLSRRFPTPPVYYLTCGSIWRNNVTWANEGLYDYFAVVNASKFTVVANNWGVIPSSAFSCDAGAYLSFAPISNTNASYGILYSTI